MPQPGKIDNKLGEFWSVNPWAIVGDGHNLSAYERNKTWVSLRGKKFLDMSYFMATDSDGDGRGAVAGDFRHTGQLDLLVRGISGGPVVLYENQIPARNYLTVNLRGRDPESSSTQGRATKSNRLGIGARLVAYARDLKVVRELYPSNGFRSQMPSQVHLGLDKAEKIDRLVIQWPSGDTQVLTDLEVNRHVVITGGTPGKDAIELVIPGKTIEP